MMIAKHRESEALFHQLFLHMGQGVVIQEADGRIVDANPAAEHILGLNLDQMRGVRPWIRAGEPSTKMAANSPARNIRPWWPCDPACRSSGW
ncbi:hypothetical protein CCP4SC76_3320004 [Gammaproteobacteria bacterium]